MARQGLEEHGMAGVYGPDRASLGKVRLIMAGMERQGLVWQCTFGQGKTRQARLGLERRGMARPGPAMHGRRGTSGQNVDWWVRQSKAGRARLVAEC